MKPIFVDKFTGYRYYDESQFPVMMLINRLKRYGFLLTEIKCFVELLYDNSDINSADNLKFKKLLFQKLKERAENIKTEISHKQMLFNEMITIIDNFERNGTVMDYKNNYKISVVESDKLNVISSRQRMSIEDFGKYYGRLFEKAIKENLKPNGIVFAVYHDKEFDEKDSDIETGIGVEVSSDDTKFIGGTLCATTTHFGSYANLSEAYTSVIEWINKNGFEIAQAPYEIYRKSGVGANIPVDEWETDIYFPVKK